MNKNRQIIGELQDFFGHDDVKSLATRISPSEG